VGGGADTYTLGSEHVHACLSVSPSLSLSVRADLWDVYRVLIFSARERASAGLRRGLSRNATKFINPGRRVRKSPEWFAESRADRDDDPSRSIERVRIDRFLGSRPLDALNESRGCINRLIPASQTWRRSMAWKMDRERAGKRWEAGLRSMENG